MRNLNKKFSSFSKKIYQCNKCKRLVNFRNNIVKLGATTFSAESKTNPGGYVVEPQSLEQFEISDERTTEEVAHMIKAQGYEPVFKDWDKVFG